MLICPLVLACGGHAEDLTADSLMSSSDPLAAENSTIVTEAASNDKASEVDNRTSIYPLAHL